MVDSHVCKTPNELLKTEGELDSGVGVDDFPEEVRNKKLGSSSKKGIGKVNTKPLDDGINRVFNPKNKDDPFRRDNWSF